MTNPLAARLLSLLRRLGSAQRIAFARATGARIASGCVIASGCDVNLGIATARRGHLEIGEGCELAQGVVLHPYGGKIRLGRNIYVGQHAVLFGHGGVDIGDDTLIAMHCRIVAAEHAIPAIGTPIRSQGDRPSPVRIGRDVWLGAGVTVLAGVTIGDGCVVGAGSVVTHDLPPGSIAMGTPARVVRQRG